MAVSVGILRPRRNANSINCLLFASVSGI